MREIKIADVILREAHSSREFSLSFKNKVEIAKLLDKIGVDVIEVAHTPEDKADALLVRTISSVVKRSTVSAAVPLNPAVIRDVWNVVSNAAHPRMHVIVPVSPVNMEYTCKMKPDKVLELIKTLVSKSAELCEDVEFSADDATRAEGEFLGKVIKTAIEAGAKTITLCDSLGTMLPDELVAFVKNAAKSVEDAPGVVLSVQTNNELGMGTACTFASIAAGALQIKTAAGGNSVPSLLEIAHAFRLRGDSLGITCALSSTELQRAVKQISWFTGGRHSETTVFENLVSAGETQDIVLDKTADITAVSKLVAQLGYELNEYDTAKVYEAFCRVARKKPVSAKELEAIVASSAQQVTPTYKLVSYVITSGNVLTPMAHIELEKHGAAMQGVSVGDGPIDASFLAIEQVIGHHYELDDFQIQAVTQGREAMGDALVKLRSNGKLYSGRGISTDVIGASIRAYVNALNKIVFEESGV